MGAYIYRIAPPSKVRTAYIDGKPVRIAALSYAYKPHWRDEDNEALDRRLIAPRDRAWDKVPEDQHPEYVVQTHVPYDQKDPELPQDGAPVREWRPHLVAVFDDNDYGRTKRIGVLRKRDGRWVIERGRQAHSVCVRDDVLVDGYGILTAGNYVLTIPEEYDWNDVKPADIVLDGNIEVVRVEALEGARA